MTSEAEQISSIRGLTIAQLEQLRTDPKPTYSIDRQQVSWTAYVESLQRTIDWCDKKIADYQPFEVHSLGLSG